MKSSWIVASFASIALVGSAAAADIPVKTRMMSAAPAWTWTGLYLGVGGGAASMSTVFKDRDDAFDNQGLTPDRKIGGTAGVYGGYNWQSGNLVLGVEGAWNWYGRTVSSSPFGIANPSYLRTKLKDSANVKGRMGLNVGNTLVYVAGGVAFGRFNFAVFNANGPATGSASSTKTGLVGAVGVEHMFTPNWVGRAQVEYTNYLTSNLTDSLTRQYGQETTTLATTVGVAYKF